MTTQTFTTRFAFGDEVTDRITGFTGVVTGFITYITGCDQYLVNPPVVDGAYKEGMWLDDIRLRLNEAAKVKLPASDKKNIRLAGASPEGPPRSAR